MGSEFDKRVGIASLTTAIVLTPSSASERIERGAKRCTTHGIEKPLDEDRASLASKHLERPVFHVLELLRLECIGIVRMTDVGAVSAEPGKGMGECLVEKRLLHKRRGGRRLLQRSRRTCQQCEMGKPESSILHCGNALSEDNRLRADRNCARRGCRGHPTLESQPLGRAQATLPLLFRCSGERSGNH